MVVNYLYSLNIKCQWLARAESMNYAFMALGFARYAFGENRAGQIPSDKWSSGRSCRFYRCHHDLPIVNSRTAYVASRVFIDVLGDELNHLVAKRTASGVFLHKGTKSFIGLANRGMPYYPRGIQDTRDHVCRQKAAASRLRSSVGHNPTVRLRTLSDRNTD